MENVSRETIGKRKYNFMKRIINTRELLLKIFLTTSVFSGTYLLLGYSCNIPNLLLFCILGTIILVPIELGMILFSSKKDMVPIH